MGGLSLAPEMGGAYICRAMPAPLLTFLTDDPVVEADATAEALSSGQAENMINASIQFEHFARVRQKPCRSRWVSTRIKSDATSGHLGKNTGRPRCVSFG